MYHGEMITSPLLRRHAAGLRPLRSEGISLPGFGILPMRIPTEDAAQGFVSSPPSLSGEAHQ
jgi:hypothetical protein